MPHALLLSPDDQAVSAISAVLEEMSVTCERPLDGVSAAQKLNSQSFDLVLVDCENLPAAKLVFDVCRRGKNGINPVPIAIVDGRAGLPTAFRLGAELILTKPVAKDQARNTIRNAVSRVRKDGQNNENVPTLPPAATLHHAVGTVEHAQAFAAAAGSSQLTNFGDPAPSHVSARISDVASDAVSDAAPNAALDVASTMLSESASTTTMHSAVEQIDAPSATPEANPESLNSTSSSHFASETSSLSGSSPTPGLAADSNLTLLTNPSDDPVLAELERAELEESLRAPDKAAPAQPEVKSFDPIFPSHPRGSSKRRGPLGAVLMLALVAAVLCAAWKYQPGFRDFAQPEINRVLALVGIAPSPSVSPASMPTPTDSQVAPGTASAPAAQSSTDQNQAQSTTPDSSAPSASASNAVPVAGATPAQPATIPPAAVQPPTSAGEVNKSSNSQVSDSKKDVVAGSSNAPLPGEDTAIVLSSKGAENRLAHSVPPKYPVEASSAQAQATVVLKAVINENGDVAGVRLVEGNAALATAAINAVKQWRYRPYIRDGKALPFQTIVIVDFQRP
jgi:TonB family protein